MRKQGLGVMIMQHEQELNTASSNANPCLPGDVMLCRGGQRMCGDGSYTASAAASFSRKPARGLAGCARRAKISSGQRHLGFWWTALVTTAITSTTVGVEGKEEQKSETFGSGAAALGSSIKNAKMVRVLVVLDGDEIMETGLRGYNNRRARLRSPADAAQKTETRANVEVDEHERVHDQLSTRPAGKPEITTTSSRTSKLRNAIRQLQKTGPSRTPAASINNFSQQNTLQKTSGEKSNFTKRQKELFRARVLGIKKPQVNYFSGELREYCNSGKAGKCSFVNKSGKSVGLGQVQHSGSIDEQFMFSSRERSLAESLFAGTLGRQLAPYSPKQCSDHAACGANHYCMSCEKCRTRTGSPDCAGDCPKPESSGTSSTGICKPAVLCQRHQDFLGSGCPTSVQGCTTDSDCNQYGGAASTAWRDQEEYCYDCTKCEQYKALHPTHSCGPCELNLPGKNSFCRSLRDCADARDAVAGSCPQAEGCRSHADCGANAYCRDCDKCLARNDPAYCARHVCPTQGGGYCYHQLSACETFADGIGGSCVRAMGCNAHTDCEDGHYCMSCAKCQAYHDSLPADRRDTWHCDPCPTSTGGSCEASRWCGVADDGVSACPSFKGCSQESDCGAAEFCLDYEACVGELSAADCGTKPDKGGFCLDHDYCTASRILGSGSCAVECDSNTDCAGGDFCADYADCVKLRGRSYCGPAPSSKKGVCMPQEHCERGLHRPLSGECPDARKYNFENPRNIVSLSDATRNFAIHHQAFNVWHNPETDAENEEYLVAQTHDDGDYMKRRDDKEYVHMWKVKGDRTVEEVKVWQTSCGSLEVIVPARGPYVYEARISMELGASNGGIAECSCIQSGYPWSSEGVCPRGVETKVGSNAGEYLPLDTSQQISFVSMENLFIVDLKQTLYSLDREVSGLAIFVPDSGCPTVPGAAESNPFHPSQSASLSLVQLSLYTDNNVPKMAGVAGKFCVAKRDSACGVSVKYRHCLYSGGKGLLIYLHDDSTEGAAADDLHVGVQLFSAERSRTDLIPAIMVSHFSTSIKSAITAGTLNLRVGPSVGGSSMTEAAAASPGGVRVVEAATGKEQAHHKLFGAVTYMEPSEIRNVLFVCTDVYNTTTTHASEVQPNFEVLKQVRVFDTGSMDSTMTEYKPRKGSVRASCEDSKYRDYHVVDFKRGDRYYSSFINHHQGNKIEVYDTTDLTDWKIMKEVHADWEDENSGLGALTTNADGSVHILTWHCALYACEGSTGSELYLLDSSHPPNRPLQGGKWDSTQAEVTAWVQFMSIHSVLRLPIQSGAEGRDVACSKENICLVSMNTDGFVVYDVGSYDVASGLHSAPRKIAEHSSTFKQSNIPTTYKRSAGAQKVFASRIRGDRFYLEHSSIELGVSVGTSATDVARNNKLWLVESEPRYVPGDEDSDRFFDTASADPIVLLTVVIKKSYGEIEQLLGVPQGQSSLEHLQSTLQHGFATALRVPRGARRFPVTSVYQLRDSVEVNLEILPDKLSPSPLTMLSMLLRQHQVQSSLLYRGVLSPIASFLQFAGAYSVVDKEVSSQSTQGGEVVTRVGGSDNFIPIDGNSAIGTRGGAGSFRYTVEAETAQIVGLSVAFGLILLLAIILIAMLALEYKQRRNLQKQVEALKREQTVAAAALGSAGSRRGQSFTVVGRPTDSVRATEGAAVGTARNEVTRGMPVSDGERYKSSPSRVSPSSKRIAAEEDFATSSTGTTAAEPLTALPPGAVPETDLLQPTTFPPSPGTSSSSSMMPTNLPPPSTSPSSGGGGTAPVPMIGQQQIGGEGTAALRPLSDSSESAVIAVADDEQRSLRPLDER
ncbi:unnamed protein product [Amoebophrya sp. A25]|nr:unnamed protein product [Amoebophrya sp. A25]|eukprot:GSA25T00015583001.1